jgi:hypothetical protein
MAFAEVNRPNAYENLILQFNCTSLRGPIKNRLGYLIPVGADWEDVP